MNLSPFRQLARETRTRLTGRWASALGVFLLPAAVLVLFGYVAGYLLFIGESIHGTLLGLSAKSWLTGIVTTLGILLVLLVLRPMWLGIVRWLAALAAGHDVGAISCLYYFVKTRYLPAVKYSLRLLGCGLLMLLPYALAVLAIFALLCQKNVPGALDLLLRAPTALTTHQLAQLKELLSDACFWAGPLVYFLLMSLFFADYRYVTAPDPSPIRYSLRMYLRCFHPLLRLWVRCFGWILLSFFVFPLLYTLPYLSMTYAVFCKWMDRTHT